MKNKLNGMTSVMPDEVKEVIEEVVEEVMPEEPVKATPKKKETTKEVIVNAALLNVRVQAKDGSDILAVVPFGTKLVAKTTLSNEKWLGVTTPDGKKGYVINEFVK